MSSRKEEKDPHNIRRGLFHTRISVQMVVKGHVVLARVRKSGEVPVIGFICPLQTLWTDTQREEREEEESIHAHGIHKHTDAHT